MQAYAPSKRPEASILDVSAVILSKRPVNKAIPGVVVVGHVSEFSDAAGLLQARFDAIAKVKTKFFFFLDDDDELPEDYLSVVHECMAADSPVAYTNEKIIAEDGREVIRRSADYSLDRHLRDAMFIHHLAVCKTHEALEAIKVLPRGHYGLEPLLYGQLAKKGATWIDRVGYVWKLRAGSMRKKPSVAFGMVNSRVWLARSGA